MIRRYSTLLSLAVIAIGMAMLFQVKYKVQALQSEAATLEKQLAEEREALHVAAAEWAYLNRPERLQVLADKYLALAPIATAQITDVPNVPMRESQLADIPKQELVVQPVSLEAGKP